ncbi:MAG: transketolase [Sedimentisphaerales bacterium]|nr:transketolase [Sedimentisphaerales bacterium]
MAAKTNPGLNELDEKCIQTIRFLSMDGVQKAKSGHPGMPMGMAPAAYVLWTRHMRHNPANPKWLGRDRFVLSAGHGSMLLYSLLYLTGYDVSLDDLKNFRQWGSKTPGHPEFGHTPGVEATTGPLGQGISNSVGMAIAQKYLSAYFDKDGSNLFDYKIYVIAGDGDLQEGVASEACSLAGHLGLGNLIVIYDDNHISIDGNTKLSFTEDRAKRFEAYGWNVQIVDGDGNDMASFEKALKKAQNQKDKPNIINLRTHIGYGSPNFQDTHTAHGAPLGEDEIKLIKKNFGWDPEKTFVVPDEVLEHMQKEKDKGSALEKEWNDKFEKYSQQNPELAELINNPYPQITDLPTFPPEPLSTRKASGATLDMLMPKMPLVLGGSADLTPSNNTRYKGVEDFQKDNPTGRYIRYGVREHGMAAIMNGIGMSELLRAYGGTFFCFSDYMRPAVRVAAMSGYRTIFVFTHDTIGLGEDGPTHQPVEHIAALRLIPKILVLRPADANETAYAWKIALEHTEGPVALLLTRQNITTFDRTKYPAAANIEKGAYVFVKADKPDVIIIGVGSEMEIAVKAAEKLAAENIKAQVVNFASWELFEKQDKAYRNSVLPASIKARVAVEAGVEMGWSKYIGDAGEFVGMHSFGISAPYKVCYEKFGITADAVAAAAKKSIAAVK